MSTHALPGGVLSDAWWKAAIVRALRTALTIAVPYVGSAALFAGVPWLSIASAAGLGFVASLITSLAGIPETSGGTVPVWLALLERTTKTVAQAVGVGIGNAVLFTDVHWSTILQAALIAGLGSLLLGVLGFLPESETSVLNGSPVDVSLAAAPVFPVADVEHGPITPQDPTQPAAGVPPSRDAS